MENMSERVKIRIVKNEKDIIKYTSKPKCIRWNIYEKKLVAIHEKKICLTLNKPIYVGFTVLETSKWEMYSSSFEEQIESIRKVENLGEDRFMEDYGDKELKFKVFQLELAYMSNVKDI